MSSEIVYNQSPIVCSHLSCYGRLCCIVCKVLLANIENYTLHKISVTGCSKNIFIIYQFSSDVFF